MSASLKISLGQYSDKGRKATNQDAHGARVPDEPLASLKGICVALADGISSSEVSQFASQAAVTSFLEDYYCTSEAWSVRRSAERVLGAANSWLHAQTQNSQFCYDRDKGYVCTFSAVVFKSTTAHLLHAGDARIYRLRDGRLEQLTEDHRIRISEDKSYLSRALGVSAALELDYRALQIERGDLFLLVTDGVYEHVLEQAMVQAIVEHGADLDRAAERIARAAFESGSPDNLTAQLVRIEAAPSQSAGEIVRELSCLPLPPMLEPRMSFEGYTITRAIHVSVRSRVYLAVEEATKTNVILKTPGVELREDEAQLDRFLVEEWIARRVRSPHVLQPRALTRKRQSIYLVSEHIDGQTLRQWMLDHPQPRMETVRQLVEQIAAGLRAFHRLEVLHQDLRPENIMIDGSGTLKIIDFGSARVASIAELDPNTGQDRIWGTEQYTAPEYFLGEAGSTRSDLYSLGVIAYELLSGRLPYGAQVSRSRTKDAQRRLVYQSVLHPSREIPAWVDGVLEKAVHTNPDKRYAELSELVHDLRHPSAAFLSKSRPPLIERNPAAFWKGVSALLALLVVWLLARQR